MRYSYFSTQSFKIEKNVNLEVIEKMYSSI